MSTYNGWTNYETWNVALWLGNDYWIGQAEIIVNDHGGNKEEATEILVNQLKDEFEEDRPDLGTSIWADLLGSALAEVNWFEIAENFVEWVDFQEQQPMSTQKDDLTKGE